MDAMVAPGQRLFPAWILAMLAAGVIAPVSLLGIPYLAQYLKIRPQLRHIHSVHAAQNEILNRIKNFPLQEAWSITLVAFPRGGFETAHLVATRNDDRQKLVFARIVTEWSAGPEKKYREFAAKTYFRIRGNTYAFENPPDEKLLSDVRTFLGLDVLRPLFIGGSETTDDELRLVIFLVLGESNRTQQDGQPAIQGVVPPIPEKTEEFRWDNELDRWQRL